MSWCCSCAVPADARPDHASPGSSPESTAVMPTSIEETTFGRGQLEPQKPHLCGQPTGIRGISRFATAQFIEDAVSPSPADVQNSACIAKKWWFQPGEFGSRAGRRFAST